MKSLHIGLLLFINAVASICLAQSGSISGRILDESDHQPLVNVAVLYGENLGVLTNDDGYFRIVELESGSYSIRFRYTGYIQQELAIELSDGQQLKVDDLSMKASANQLQEIRVSSGATTYSNDYAGSNTYISPRLLREIQPMGTEEILRTVPGLNVIGDMGLSNRPNISIRGSWGRRSYKVLLLEDGSYIAPAPYIGPGAYYNPPSDRVEAIRVIKGAETLLYGPNNMFGVVNYITRRPPAEPEVRFKLSGGQRAYTTAQASYGGTWNQLGTDVQLLYKRFDGYQDNSDVGIFNLHTKFYFELDERQSFYFKLGYQRERNNASLASQTPFTFDTDPVQNPFDADEFTSRRYALDVIHKYAVPGGWSLTTKLYGADFARDWWRQKTSVIRADEVRSYLGETIFQDRYSYMEDLTPGPDDYVRVGRVVDNHEATTDSKWNYTFAGLQEQVEKKWQAGAWEGELTAGGRLHKEIYLDQFLENDSSRWARSGQYTSDLRYDLWSGALWAKHAFSTGRITVSPLLRFEHVEMVRQDLLAAGNAVVQQPSDQFELSNQYDVLLPGLALDVRLGSNALGSIKKKTWQDLTVFSSVYRGFISPNNQFAFLVEENGVVSSPTPGQITNLKPETSLNLELGLRGTLLNGVLSGQVAGFRNAIRNFYAAGRGELFQSIGEVLIAGAEAGVDWDITQMAASSSRHRVVLGVNATFLQSRIQSGELRDRDLATLVVHSSASAQELADKINGQPGITAFVLDGSGNEVPFSGVITVEELSGITALAFNFSDPGLSDYEAPYTPPISLHTRLSYRYKDFGAGLEYHYLASQYTEYANFESESSDGAIGKLPAYGTYDAQLNYRLNRKGITWEFFLIGKNLSNEIYRASRLNRVTSGIFPGGFRQINGGVGVTF